MLKTLFDWWPIIGGLIVWGVSIERRLARIQVDISWIKKKME